MTDRDHPRDGARTLRRAAVRASRRRAVARTRDHRRRPLLARWNAELPDAAVLASLGCGNPTAVADLREGERVLDLGSGGGIDVLLSAGASDRAVARSAST